jgi:hypothetical protein
VKVKLIEEYKRPKAVPPRLYAVRERGLAPSPDISNGKLSLPVNDAHAQHLEEYHSE